MIHSAVSVLVVAQSSSEIPEGLTNNPVLYTCIASRYYIIGGSGTTGWFNCQRCVSAIKKYNKRHDGKVEYGGCAEELRENRISQL